MKRGLYFFIMIFALTLYSSAQTLVLPGENALSTAIASAEDGAVLQLISGGEYPESGETVGIIDKNITIEVENYTPDLQKPVVFFTQVEGEGTTFFQLRDGASITVRGIEFHGVVGSAAQVSYLMQADITDLAVETTINKITIDGCYIHDLVDNAIDAGNSDMKGYVLFDSTFVNNTIMHNLATTLYYKYSGENYIEITNSTFYKLTSYGIRVAGPGESTDYDHTPAAFIDHVTMYDAGSLDGREMILLEKGPNMNSWVVQNSIFQLQHNKDKTVINLKDHPDGVQSIVQNICLWDVGARKWASNIVRDTINVDPEFGDPENGDFTLPEGSQLYTFGTDGGAIGDPRWAKFPVAVENEENSIPTEFTLQQNYPNPFNPTTSIKFAITKPDYTSLKVYDVLGREIATLVNKELTSGVYTYDFNASDLASGVYIYQLTSGNFKSTKKMLLNK